MALPDNDRAIGGCAAGYTVEPPACEIPQANHSCVARPMKRLKARRRMTVSDDNRPIGGYVKGFASQAPAGQVAKGNRAFAVPLIIRSIRHADAVAEALVARGLED